MELFFNNEPVKALSDLDPSGSMAFSATAEFDPLAFADLYRRAGVARPEFEVLYASGDFVRLVATPTVASWREILDRDESELGVTLTSVEILESGNIYDR